MLTQLENDGKLKHSRRVCSRNDAHCFANAWYTHKVAYPSKTLKVIRARMKGKPEEEKRQRIFPFHELSEKTISPATFRFHLHVNVSSSVNKKLSANAVRVVLGFYAN